MNAALGGLTRAREWCILVPMNQIRTPKVLVGGTAHLGTALLVSDNTGPEFTQ